jgi:hypothetical protein
VTASASVPTGVHRPARHVVAFLGPSLAAADALAIDPALDLRPPARCGDVHRAAHEHPDAIVLVDGLFEHVRSTWHKEILFALDAGIAVIGASSMGALRAAECAAFGMEPVGRIALDYTAGRRTRDSDVALAHGDAADRWAPRSEPLVNVDATLERAVGDGVVDAGTAAVVHDTAAAVFYAERTWPLVLHLARDVVAASSLDALRRWLPDHRVDQKAADARDALRRASVAAPPRAGAVGCQRTIFFDALDRALLDDVAPDAAAWNDLVLDELRLDAARHGPIALDAQRRALAVRWQDAVGVELGAEETQAAFDALRYRLGALTPEDVDAWQGDQALSEAQLRRLVRRQAAADWSSERLSGQTSSDLLDGVRLRGLLADLATRARAKRAALDDAGLDDASLRERSDDEALLVAWLTAQRPDDAPRAASFLYDHGYHDVEALLRALRREDAYRSLAP